MHPTKRLATSVSQQMRETLFFYLSVDSVSVQNGSPDWSELLIPHLGVRGLLARQDSEGTFPAIRFQARSCAYYFARAIGQFRTDKTFRWEYSDRDR
jgi:hypothetical protein